MDGKGIMAVAFALLAAGSALAKPAPGELSAEERAKAEARMRELSREMAELGRKLGDDGRVRVIEDRLVAMDRAMLGINVDDAASTKGGKGVVVAAVTPNGPAGKAGVRSGDVIVSIDGKPLKAKGDDSPFDLLREAMGAKRPGDVAKLKLERDGKPLDLAVTTESYAPRAFAFGFGGDDEMRRFELLLPPMPPAPALAPRAPRVPSAPGLESFRFFVREWGELEMVSLSPKLGEYFGAKEGVLVVHAPDDAALPLEDGDVILRIGDRKPANPEQVMRILRSYEAGEKLKVEVLRDRKPVMLDIELPQRGRVGRVDDGGELIDLLAPLRG